MLLVFISFSSIFSKEKKKLFKSLSCALRLKYFLNLLASGIYFLHENEFKIVLLANPSNLNASSAPRTAVLSGCNRIASFLYALLTSSWVDPGSIPNCCQAFCPLPNLDITACWSVLGCGRVVSLQLEEIKFKVFGLIL